MVHEQLSFAVIGCCMAVHNSLGSGLLERCYHNALYYELQAEGLAVEYGKPYSVLHRGQVVGEYFADLVVENKIIIEIKAARRLSEEHTAQVLNYLNISGLKLGLLVNFQGSKLEWKRFVC